ncbi:MAG: hypothetical protein JST51_19050 [Armatimonadetes bacterium]|nr:hypothetical protein [Armatimonadota bacterium]
MRNLRAVFVLVLACLGVSAFATPDILKEFKAIYNKPATTCEECHTKPPKRNAFGKAVKDALDQTQDGMLTKEVMKPLEQQDSDGDGVSNIDEINAGTLPGDPNSKPAAGATNSAPSTGDSQPGGAEKSELIPKHSFHPALVHFPIALLAIAAVLEVFARRKPESGYHAASVINLAIGLICSTAAIATGVAAWLRLGYDLLHGDLLIHVLLASGSILVGIGAYTQREKPSYLPLILVSGLLVLAAGHFGGNMVFG